MRGRQIPYSADELAFIEWRQAMSRTALHAAFIAEFRRTEIKVDDIKSLCSRKGWSTGRNGRFAKGLVPANKGKKMPFNANSARTQFKKGARTGRAAVQYKPIGTERLTKDGYLERKIHDGMPLQSRWRAVHLVRWEEINGPVAAGMALKCVDGDRQNTDPSNWLLVPRAFLPRLNARFGRGYDDAPAELKPTILAVVKLEHAAAKYRRRSHSNHEPSGRTPT